MVCVIVLCFIVMSIDLWLNHSPLRRHILRSANLQCIDIIRKLIRSYHWLILACRFLLLKMDRLYLNKLEFKRSICYYISFCVLLNFIHNEVMHPKPSAFIYNSDCFYNRMSFHRSGFPADALFTSLSILP